LPLFFYDAAPLMLDIAAFIADAFRHTLRFRYAMLRCFDTMPPCCLLPHAR